MGGIFRLLYGRVFLEHLDEPLPAMHVELRIDSAHVGSYGSWGDEQLARDLLVRFPLGHEQGDALFARAELVYGGESCDAVSQSGLLRRRFGRGSRSAPLKIEILFAEDHDRGRKNQCSQNGDGGVLEALIE